MSGRGRALDGRLDRWNRSRPGREPGRRARARSREQERVKRKRGKRERKQHTLEVEGCVLQGSYSGTVALTTRIHACASARDTRQWTCDQSQRACARQFRPSFSPPVSPSFPPPPIGYHHPRFTVSPLLSFSPSLSHPFFSPPSSSWSSEWRDRKSVV